jgi:hypothetical protein
MAGSLASHFRDLYVGDESKWDEFGFITQIIVFNIMRFQSQSNIRIKTK